MNRLLYFTATLTALALARFGYTPGYDTALGFAVSASLFAFLSFLERKNTNASEAMEARMKRIEDQMSNVSVTLGWTQTR